MNVAYLRYGDQLGRFFLAGALGSSFVACVTFESVCSAGDGVFDATTGVVGVEAVLLATAEAASGSGGANVGVPSMR